MFNDTNSTGQFLKRFTSAHSDTLQKASDTSSQPVSWQSAFWPLVACTLNVVIQYTGRVCGAHYCDSYALRSSPLVCIFDTIMMLVKFFLMVSVGCSGTVAAQHVWHDRFEKEDERFCNTFMVLDGGCVTRNGDRDARPLTMLAGNISHSFDLEDQTDGIALVGWLG